MTLRKLLFIIAGGLGVLGAFLPWAAAVTFIVSIRMNAFQMGEPLPIILAILSILCGVAIILLTVMKKSQIEKTVKVKNLDKMPLYLSIALVAIAVIAFIYVKANGGGVANASFGIWMIGLSGVAGIALTYLKNIEVLDKVVIGEAPKSAKSAKAEKTESTEKAKKPAKEDKPAKKSEKSSK